MQKFFVYEFCIASAKRQGQEVIHRNHVKPIANDRTTDQSLKIPVDLFCKSFNQR